ncbi:MAG: Crp/Fnr family transcriptional regulator [Fulvivirga sp.]
MDVVSLPFEDSLKQEIAEKYQSVTLVKGTVLAESGKYMKMIPLVLKGSIRVYRIDYERDREILLYYIPPGETCMMSLVASFMDMQSKVNAVTEKDSELLLIPTAKVREWQIKYPLWNRFILEIFLHRYTELLNTINDLSFKNIEERLQNYLIQCYHRQGSTNIAITHQRLANELGTTRVVVSRLLKDLEKKGVVDLLRGEIKFIGKV